MSEKSKEGSGLRFAILNAVFPVVTLDCLSQLSIRLRFAHHLGPHGIEMDVTNQLAQIPIALAQNCIVSALQNMAHLAISAIVILTVTSQDPVHDAANRICLTLDQQVHMIGHEAMSVNEEWQLFLLHF